MLELLGFALSVAAAIIGFMKAKDFVSRRLRFVDAAQRPLAPILAGVGAWLVALLIGALIPGSFIGAGTAVVFGVSVGAGVAAGARDIRRSLPPGSP